MSIKWISKVVHHCSNLSPLDTKRSRLYFFLTVPTQTQEILRVPHLFTTSLSISGGPATCQLSTDSGYTRHSWSRPETEGQRWQCADPELSICRNRRIGHGRT